MFQVENADFIAEKLASELLPNQEFREVLKNALEAVERRMDAASERTGGRVEFDVDWVMLEDSQRWYVSCSDNGDGMTRSELEKYTTTLAVQGAGQNQSIRGNQGMGLKISGPTRHKKGILIRSLKNGERTMLQVGWNGREYGLIPIGPNDERIVSVSIDAFPGFIRQQNSGTVVTFLGNTDDANTFVPPGRTKGWLMKYLNTRFFRLSGRGIDVLVRVPTGDEEDWPKSASEASDRARGKGGRSFNLTRIDGTAELWDEASDRQGDGWRGVMDLPGQPADGVPPARIHWWILPSGSGTDVSSRTMSGGSLAVLFDNELHDWRISSQANSFFARLGVLYGKTRIAFVVEPTGDLITSDVARAHVLVCGKPVFESDAWLQWADQFRSNLPERIRETMIVEQARLEVEDPNRAKRIRDRLKDVMQLLRPRFFRRAPQGSIRASTEVTGSGSGEGRSTELPSLGTGNGRPSPQRERLRGIGSLLSSIDDERGQPSVETNVTFNLVPRWVTEAEADDLPIVNGDEDGLRDRAAALAGTDGRTANELLLNRQFRGFQAILAAANEWANPEGDDAKVKRIEDVAREWVEQKMIEAVQGLRQLENGRTWITKHYDEALSPVALTAAFMADRYHTLAEVKRATAMLRQARPAPVGAYSPAQ